MSNELRQTPIIVLCGGLGTRLQNVLVGKPKILAPIGDKTLLDIIISMLSKAGFEQIILGVGYLREQIKKHTEQNNYRVIFSEEEEPLGTGGAIKAALHFVHSEQFFVINGDMIFSPDFSLLHRFHRAKNALMSLVITRGYVEDGGKVITVDENNRVTQWRDRMANDQLEKIYLNAGTYLMEKEVMRFFPEKKTFSLERDVFPTLFSETCYGCKTDGVFIDIGVPERYELVRKMFTVVD